MYFMFTFISQSSEVRLTSVIYVNLPLCMLEIKLYYAKHVCNYASTESKYLDQHAHMHMLINAFAIPSAIMIIRFSCRTCHLVSDDIQTRLD